MNPLQATQSAQDLYPSRVAERPTISDRQDPILYGGVNDGPLSNDELRRYEKDGFLFAPNLFGKDEVARCLDELKRLSADPKVRESEEAILEPGGGALRSLFKVDAFSQLYDRVRRDARVLDRARQLLGSEVYVTQSRINLKPGFKGNGFFWHSDFETWHVEDGMPRMRAVSCSILLTDNNPFNGPLMLVPGSHKKFVSCVGATPEAHYQDSLKSQEYGVPDPESMKALVDEGGIVAPTGQAGSVLFFECNTMHGSAGNLSPWPRSNLFFVFNSIENQLVDPFCGLAPRPDFLARRGPVEPLRPAE